MGDVSQCHRPLPGRSVACRVRGQSAKIVNKLLGRGVFPHQAQPLCFQVEPSEPQTQPPDAAAVIPIHLFGPWDELSDAARAAAETDELYRKYPPKRGAPGYPFLEGSRYSKKLSRQFTDAFSKAYRCSCTQEMKPQNSKQELIKSPLWQVTVYFMGYLAWINGRTVHDNFRTHWGAVQSSKQCMEVGKRADILLTLGYFPAMVVHRAIRQNAKNQPSVTVNLRQLTGDETQREEMILEGVKPEDVTADLAVSWHPSLMFTQFSVHAERFGRMNIGGEVKEGAAHVADQTIDVYEQYRQLLTLVPGLEVPESSAKRCRLDVESILGRIVQRSKAAYAHQPGTADFLCAIKGELQKASSLYTALTQAIVGRVPVCLLTDGYLCIFLLLQSETCSQGVRWGFKHYVCFTCAKEDGRATAYEVLHYLLKGPAHIKDKFAGISDVKFPSNDAMRKERSCLQFISFSEINSLLGKIRSGENHE